MNEPIETEIVKTDAVAVVKNPPPAIVEPTKAPVTAAQAKVEAIADLTHSAYQKAATLQLTKEESEALQRDFPDEAFKPGAGGKESLIYIEHAFLRDRFNEVFGMGSWAIVPRSRWSEKFTIPAWGSKPAVEAERIYVEAMLIVRGCFVGEAVGSMEYYLKNNAQNYGDGVEGAKTSAFRRCAKEFGVGLQAWKKDWCDGWWARKKNVPLGTQQPPPTESTQRPVTPTARPTAKPSEPKEATDKTLKEWFIPKLGQDVTQAEEYLIALGWLMQDESIENLSLHRVPTSTPMFEQFIAGMKLFYEGNMAVNPYLPKSKTIEVPRDENIDHNSPSAPWRLFPMPNGKCSGQMLAELDKNYLYGLWANFTAEETWTNSEGRVIKTKPEKLEKDRVLRAMLDEAGKHYSFQKKD